MLISDSAKDSGLYSKRDLPRIRALAYVAK